MYVWANEDRDEVYRDEIIIYVPSDDRLLSWRRINTTYRDRDEVEYSIRRDRRYDHAVLAYLPASSMEEYRLQEWLNRRLASLRQELSPEAPEETYRREYVGRFADPRDQVQINPPPTRFYLDALGRWMPCTTNQRPDYVCDSGEVTEQDRSAMALLRVDLLEERVGIRTTAVDQDITRSPQSQRDRLIEEYNRIQPEARGLRGRSFFDTIIDEVAPSPIDNFMAPFIERMGQHLISSINNTTSSVGEEGDTMQAEKVVPTSMNKPLVDKGKIMASLIGVRLTNDDIKHMSTLATQTEINQYIIAKKGAPRTPKQLTEEQRKLIARAYSVENSAEYKAKVKSLASTNANIDGLNRSLSEQYTKLYKLQDEIDNMLANMTINKDLTKEVETLLADGYWELMEIDDEAITFSTDKVYCQHPDIKPMNVLMGTFMVSFYWADGHVDVHPLADNLVIDGYRHPHVNGSGSVCWGTGRDAYEAARKTAKLSTIFKIVRSILQDYNPGSPYRKLIQFDLLRNKNKYESMKKVFSPSRDTKPLAWVIVKYSDEYVEHRGSPTHGDIYKYQIFARYYEGTDQRCDENIYIKDPTHMDGWRPVSRSAIAEWSDT